MNRKSKDKIELTKSEINNASAVYEAGFEYLEILKGKMKNWVFTSVQFRNLLNDPTAAKMTAAEWLKTIQNSPKFWAWWEVNYQYAKEFRVIPSRVICDIFNIEHSTACNKIVTVNERLYDKAVQNSEIDI